MRVNQADAIWTQQANPELPGDLEAAGFQGRAQGTGFAETSGGDDDRVDAPSGGFLDQSWNPGGWDEQHRQIDRIGNLAKVSVNRPSQETPAFYIHEMDRPAVPALNQITG
jgi:hypothetical protein